MLRARFISSLNCVHCPFAWYSQYLLRVDVSSTCDREWLRVIALCCRRRFRNGSCPSGSGPEVACLVSLGWCSIAAQWPVLWPTRAVWHGGFGPTWRADKEGRGGKGDHPFLSFLSFPFFLFCLFYSFFVFGVGRKGSSRRSIYISEV
jgi:hypothetical protein